MKNDLAPCGCRAVAAKMRIPKPVSSLSHSVTEPVAGAGASLTTSCVSFGLVSAAGNGIRDRLLGCFDSTGALPRFALTDFMGSGFLVSGSSALRGAAICRTLPEITVYVNAFPLCANDFRGAAEIVRQCQWVRFWAPEGLQNRVHQFNSGRGLHQYNQSFALTICEAARSSSRRPSAGGVPALGKWNKRPGAPVVIGGLRQFVGHRQRRQIIRQIILLGSGFDSHLHGLQQSVEFSFAHRALRGSGAQWCQKCFGSKLKRSLKL